MHVDGTRVLLIEDDPNDAYVLMEALRRHGAQGIIVKRADTLGAALRELEQTEYEVILLDLSLPDANGLESVIHLRRAFPMAAIIALTGPDDEFLAARAVRQGAQDYLIKDSAADHLLVRAIRYALERRSAIEALQRREQHFRSLIENARDMISIVQQDGTIRYASPSHERVLGYPVEELVGKPALWLVHEDDVSFVKAALAQADVELGFEYRVRHRDGSWRYVESFAHDLTSMAGVQGLVLNSRDMTERRNLEEGLQQANLARVVLQGSPLAICTTDVEGRVRTWNRCAQRMFGWSEPDVLDRTLTDVISFNSADHVETALGLDARCRRRDGQVIDVEFWSERLRDASGGTTVMVHIFADMSERKLQQQAAPRQQ